MSVRRRWTIAIQVSGKVRDHVTIAAGMDEAALRALEMSRPCVAQWLGGKEARKVIVVPGRLVNVLG